MSVSKYLYLLIPSDDKDVMVDLSCAVKVGFLHKKGTVRRTWSSRYFVLTDRVFAYYKNETVVNEKPLGFIPLKGSRVVEDVFQRYENVITVWDKHEFDYPMRASSHEEMTAWMVAIQSTLSIVNQSPLQTQSQDNMDPIYSHQSMSYYQPRARTFSATSADSAMRDFNNNVNSRAQWQAHRKTASFDMLAGLPPKDVLSSTSSSNGSIGSVVPTSMPTSVPLFAVTSASYMFSSPPPPRDTPSRRTSVDSEPDRRSAASTRKLFKSPQPPPSPSKNAVLRRATLSDASLPRGTPGETRVRRQTSLCGTISPTHSSLNIANHLQYERMMSPTEADEHPLPIPDHVFVDDALHRPTPPCDIVNTKHPLSAASSPAGPRYSELGMQLLERQGSGGSGDSALSCPPGMAFSPPAVRSELVDMNEMLDQCPWELILNTPRSRSSSQNKMTVVQPNTVLNLEMAARNYLPTTSEI